MSLLVTDGLRTPPIFFRAPPSFAARDSRRNCASMLAASSGGAMILRASASILRASCVSQRDEMAASSGADCGEVEESFDTGETLCWGEGEGSGCSTGAETTSHPVSFSGP